MDLLTALTWFSGIAFIYFGFNCFYSKFLVAEFERYGLPKQRQLTGWLQLLGAGGLLVGLYFSPLLLFSAACGLFLLMTAGFIVRLKIKDNFIKSAPSFVFALLNLLIAVKTCTQFFIATVE